MKPRKLARQPEYAAIPQKVLDAGWNKAVHVEGWSAAYRFFYVGTSGGTHTISSSKGRYSTNRNLLYTKRHQPIA